jgi:hypothetical protein
MDAPRNECVENLEISIPDKNKTCFSHLAKVQEVTALNVLKETNNLLDFLKL